ncbi:BON domain-containing protein [Defluviimonas sp. WL0002]|uniref:BON domain-containing protein n=1 Tax=Albidovulum marisflavi TaxID=2984159 RepID=A0ABT2ZDF7_9RHOB|nr:BON domain-containing protein [Defluviimonas sp. WL0002]MCV2869110.1 BON domain-containing protein [Defluviimonas sp. WL0002]
MKKSFEATHNPIADAPVDPPPDQPGDSALLAAVHAAIAADGRLAEEPISIVIRDGCATLTGTVSYEYQRVLADACVSSVPGILVVLNQLDVQETGPMAYPD